MALKKGRECASEAKHWFFAITQQMSEVRKMRSDTKVLHQTTGLDNNLPDRTQALSFIATNNATDEYSTKPRLYEIEADNLYTLSQMSGT